MNSSSLYLSVLCGKKHISIFLTCLLITGYISAGLVSTEQPGLLPMPQSVTWNEKSIPFSSVKIELPALKSNPLKRQQIVSELTELFSENSVLISQKAGTYPLSLKLDSIDAPYQKDEAYQLISDQNGISITANTINGLYYGTQTLRQLVVRKDDQTTVAACKIHDYPAFKIRGFMHDVGRNFQSLDFLKQQIDIMAAYKMNIFHWHLSDHYGWRLESRKYPGLTAGSSTTRDQGKFYTQEEFKGFLDYCWARNIIVIPEFDTPGHSEAFRAGVGVKNMQEPLAKKAIIELIDEICTLARPERMPYFHIGTDEVRQAEERVDSDYLPALFDTVHRNGREVIGWWKGMSVPGDTRQIQQSWAQSTPRKGNRHIDSRSNYVNHMEALDCATRMLFQQPCRTPHGDEINLGGILCYWPDIRVADQEVGIRNSPVLLGMVAYSEAVWKGIEKDRPEYWAKLPAAGTPEYTAYTDFENRIAEQRDRFLSDKPFLFVKSAHIPWRLLGPVAEGELPGFEKMEIQEIYNFNNDVYRWTKPLYGGAIHVKHFFGFPGHLKTIRKGKDVVWAHTYIHSDKEQEVDAWISFNTTSTSDNRAGVAQAEYWNANQLCGIWINDKEVPPPRWQNSGTSGKEFPFTDEIYTSREPTKIQLKKGWNKVLLRTSPSWKWVFTFTPIKWDGTIAREIEDLRFAIKPE